MKEPQATGWRFFGGIVLFILGLICPAFIPLITSTSLPVQWKTVLSGLFMLGIPEIMWMAAVAVMGKSGFDALKSGALGFLKKHGPPDTVSLTRYRIGLVMFLIPLVFGWLAPYAPHFIPTYESNRLYINLSGDLMFISSLFVLGGDFWDKVRALFIHDAKAIIPDK